MGCCDDCMENPVFALTRFIFGRIHTVYPAAYIYCKHLRIKASSSA
jgi:hypothetical protein